MRNTIFHEVKSYDLNNILDNMYLSVCEIIKDTMHMKKILVNLIENHNSEDYIIKILSLESMKNSFIPLIISIKDKIILDKNYFKEFKETFDKEKLEDFAINVLIREKMPKLAAAHLSEVKSLNKNFNKLKENKIKSFNDSSTNPSFQSDTYFQILQMNMYENINYLSVLCYYSIYKNEENTDSIFNGYLNDYFEDCHINNIPKNENIRVYLVNLLHVYLMDFFDEIENIVKETKEKDQFSHMKIEGTLKLE